MSGAEAAPPAAAPAAETAHPAAAPSASGDPDEVIHLVVARGVTVYLPRGTHPFREGQVVSGRRRDIGHLLDQKLATVQG